MGIERVHGVSDERSGCEIEVKAYIEARRGLSARDIGL